MGTARGGLARPGLLGGIEYAGASGTLCGQGVFGSIRQQPSRETGRATPLPGAGQALGFPRARASAFEVPSSSHSGCVGGAQVRLTAREPRDPPGPEAR